jgi:hypothetical protein
MHPRVHISRVAGPESNVKVSLQQSRNQVGTAAILESAKMSKKSFLMTWQDTEHIRQPHPPCSQQPTTMSNQPQQETRSKRLREKANGTINGEDSSLTDSKKRPRGDDSNAVEKTRNQGVCRIFVRFLDTQREWVRNCTSCRL